MFNKLIEKINPKPRFNLEFYPGKDEYSDGDIEEIILNIVAENEPEEYIQAINNNFNWPVYYHLTQVRRNLLNWYPFDKDSSVLEIGCGMGAITNMLCDACKDVTAVELSKRRATTTLLRCRDKDNLEIIVGNLNDIKFEKTYDYITLIGVLEYQGNYTKSDEPYVDFLKKIKKLLKPKGKLIIAIENQFGIKYWCGAKEDHVGIPFEGINSYVHVKRGVRTFSKESLKELLKKAGFDDTYFYYPMPDYKLPTMIFSENYLPKKDNITEIKYYYIPNDKTLFADERLIYNELIKNNVFEFFSNSFLVECGKEDLGNIIYAKLNSTRDKDYQTGIRITSKNTVERFCIDKKAKNHLKNSVIYENRLKENGLSVVEGKEVNGNIEYKKCSYRTVHDLLTNLYDENNIQEIMNIWNMIYEDILKSSQEVASKYNILYDFELGLKFDEKKYGKILQYGYVDMIPQNAFYVENDENIYMQWFDQEYMLENVPANFIMYRAIWYFYCLDNKKKEQVIPFQKLCKEYGISEAMEEYKMLSSLFVSSVLDENLIDQSNYYRGKPGEAVLNNITKILEN